jgi:glutathione S-transferase
MIIGLFYVLIDPSSFIAINVIRAGVIGRILHTVAYLNELQPWRAIGFFICLLSTLYMSFQVALFFY